MNVKCFRIGQQKGINEHLCVRATVFTLRDLLYQQTKGLPMVSPTSPHISMLKSVPIIPTVWRRYADDKFVLLDRSSVPQFHAHINNQEGSIIFTKEEEDEHQLPFLDCLISRTPEGVFCARPLNLAEACILRSGVKCENRRFLVYQRF